MADRKGFEPSIRLLVYLLSREAPSTTRPPIHLQFCLIISRNQVRYYILGISAPTEGTSYPFCTASLLQISVYQFETYL